MASSLRLQVATVIATVPFAKSDAQVADVLRWFIKEWAEPEPAGLATAGLNQWRLEQAAARIVEFVKQEARLVRLRELREGQANLEDQAGSETEL